MNILLQSEACYSSTLAKSGFAYSEVTDCASKEGQDVQNEGKKATDVTGHTYVPWVLVDGTLLDNTNLLLHTICADYTGPKPASCARAAKSVEADRCFL